MKDYHWELISKYLAGESTDAENKQTEALLSSDKDFAEAMADARNIWENVGNSNNKFNKDRIMKLRDAKIQKARSFGFRRLLPYAAVLAGLVFALYFVFNNRSDVITVAASEKNIENYILPDGSTVFLRKGAVISFKKSFNRNVILKKGEVFFSVKKDNGEPFSVNTHDFTIDVLGTKFDVVCDNRKTEVILSEGKVKLSGFDKINNEAIIMKPGDMVVYDRAVNRIEKTVVNPAIYVLWKENKLEFNRFSMHDLVDVFRIYYHKTLIINDDDLTTRKIGGSAPADDVELILQGLSKVLNRNISQTKDTIIIE